MSVIIYDNLWKTMKKRGISQYRLINEFKISAGQLSRLRANANVNSHTIDILCEILNCEVGDIMQYVPKPKDS